MVWRSGLAWLLFIAVLALPGGLLHPHGKLTLVCASRKVPAKMINQIKENLCQHEAFTDLDFQGQTAAVLIPVTREDNPHVILTRRASGLSSHSGEVAWPGGKFDLEDGCLRTTALREAEEEIGLPTRDVDILGQLKPFLSKHGLQVTPFVGVIPEAVQLTPNTYEAEAIFRVPLSYLITDPRTSTVTISRHGETARVPTYHYQGNKIWGLTAMILVEFLNVSLGTNIST